MHSATPTSHSYYSQRLRLHYLDWGNFDAPPLLLVHGNRDHCHNWAWEAQALRDEYHVIALDFRGHGDSQWVHGSTYNHTDYVYDLAQLIYQLRLAPLKIIAHSLGGSVALRYAGVFPENIEKMVIIEGTGGPAWAHQDMPVHEKMRAWIESTRAISGRLPKRYEALEDACQRMHNENSHLTEDQARHLTGHGSNQNEDGSYSWKFDNYSHVMAPFDISLEQTRALWKRILSPLQLLSGSESLFGQNTETDPDEYFANASHIILENAGHWVHHDQLEQFLTLTRHFFCEPHSEPL